MDMNMKITILQHYNITYFMGQNPVLVPAFREKTVENL